MKHFPKVKVISAFCAVLMLSALMAGCASAPVKVEPKGMVYFNYFDTVSYVYCYINDSAEQFESCSADVAVILEEYHQLFDIYNEYTGINNLCTLNKNAGGEALKVDEKLIDFLLYARELHNRTDGHMNVMMGSVLRLWHDCREAAAEDRENASVPDIKALEDAAKHTSIELLEIDEENCTVRISDPHASIDVGALGKGYAIERAADFLSAEGKLGYVLNVGGNIRIIGTKPDGSGWVTGIKNPKDPSTIAVNITIADTSCVTSGSYERFFIADGKKYHHIIDPDTLFPAEYFDSVTVITPDSGVADCLSTALFCMSYEEGLKLLESFGAEALWILPDGEKLYSPGMEQLVNKA
ncbi:MAG: FAD:protein FMN transferase [Oscillospiraceae bacterium]|nr:FAD:protein FMN transferase [Oscillospiraceae bacterium]